MKIEWVAPSPELRPLVHTFYLIDSGSDTIDEPTPAYSAQLVVFLEGAVELEYEDLPTFRNDALLLSAPRLVAGRVRIEQRVRAAGASLTPLGWAALTGLPVHKVHDCPVESDVYASHELVDKIAAWRTRPGRDSGTLRQGLDHIEAILNAARHPVSQRNRAFIEQFHQWLTSDLNPPLSKLYDRLPLGERQIQRLSRQFFGAAPSQVSMRHRAIRIAMLLSNPDLPQAMREDLVATYFDQAHLIRSIRRFTGRTPVSLASTSLTKATLDPQGHGGNAAVFHQSPET